MMIQPQIDFCCFRLVAINIALTHCYKLVSFLNLMNIRHHNWLANINVRDLSSSSSCFCSHLKTKLFSRTYQSIDQKRGFI